MKLEQAHKNHDKQQTAIDGLEQALGQLKVEQREQSAKHREVTEALVNNEQEAKQLAAEVRVNSLALHVCCCRL